MECIPIPGGIDTIYTGMIVKTNAGKIRFKYTYKARIVTTEKGRFYQVKFTDLNSGHTGGILYDIAKNQCLIGKILVMDLKYWNEGFIKRLLSEMFFVWLNRSYYLK